MTAMDQRMRKDRRQRSQRFYTIAEIADRLGVSTRTVHRWIANGDLVAHRLGGSLRVSESDLELFLAARRDDG
jgi:excisionase family DNA binding protein